MAEGYIDDFLPAPPIWQFLYESGGPGGYPSNTRALLLFGIYIRAPVSWKIAHMACTSGTHGVSLIEHAAHPAYRDVTQDGWSYPDL